MNVLEHYDEQVIGLSDPEIQEKEQYYCHLNYNESPFIIQTNRICYSFKEMTEKIHISLVSQDYTIWMEKLYLKCIELIYENSADWFEDELSHEDIESSFISPLKSNIKQGCYDIQCCIEKNNMIIVDKDGRITNKNNLKNYKIIPTIHVKGIRFNSKNFSLDLSLKSVIVLEEISKKTFDPSDEVEHGSDKEPDDTTGDPTDDTTNDTTDDTTNDTTNDTTDDTTNDTTDDPTNDTTDDTTNDTTDDGENTNCLETFKDDEDEYDLETIKDEDDNDSLTEFQVDAEDDLCELNLNDITPEISSEDLCIQNHDFANIYEFMDRKIKEDVLEHLKISLLKKKIKINIDLEELFEQDIESDED